MPAMINLRSKYLSWKVILAAFAVCSVTDLSAQESCDLFTASGLRSFHEEHIDMTKGVTTSAADSLHFFYKDDSLQVLEAFLAWGKAQGFSTGMQKGIIRREQTLHFIKLSTILDDLSFKRFTEIVDMVLAKKKELDITDCGAMAVGHPNSTSHD